MSYTVRFSLIKTPGVVWWGEAHPEKNEMYLDWLAGLPGIKKTTKFIIDENFLIFQYEFVDKESYLAYKDAHRKSALVQERTDYNAANNITLDITHVPDIISK
jgi:hypothetical protein